MKNMFIAIEGIDGAGKTSVAKIVAKQLQYEYSGQKALSNFMEIDEPQYLAYCTNFRNNVVCDHNKMYWLYALSCLLVADINNVVCDRHLATVHFWYGNESNLCIAESIYLLSKKPDITFVLDVSLEKAIERVNKKFAHLNMETEEYRREIEKAKHAPQFKKKAELFLQQFDLSYKVIDTDNLSIAQVADTIIGNITAS